jgi:hypothetical protein
VAATSIPISVPESARLPYPARNALGRWRTLLSMIMGVGIALSIAGIVAILAALHGGAGTGDTGSTMRPRIGITLSTTGMIAESRDWREH